MTELKRMMIGAAFRAKTMRDGGLLYSFAPGHGRCIGYKCDGKSDKYVMVFAAAEEPLRAGMKPMLDEETLNVFGLTVDTPEAADGIAEAFRMMALEMRRGAAEKAGKHSAAGKGGK